MSAPILPKSSSPNNWLSTAIGGSTLTGGTTTQDQLAANATNVTLVGAALDDTYIAYDPSTKVVEAAGEGVDTVQTWGSGYTLSANVENLTLMGSNNSYATGNAGNNLITGNAGNNRIVTGGGNDVLVGSGGADTYVPTKEAGSVTWITGFKASGTMVDKIDVRGFGLSGFSGVQSRMSQIGGDVQIDLGNGQKVMLENKTLAELTAANFTVEAASSTPPSTQQPSVPGLPAGLNDLVLTFADEFDTLNLYSTWKPTDGWGNRTLIGNKELELYVDPQYKGLGLNPFSVKDGVLSITAAKADPALVPQLGGYQYTSGMLSSHASFSQQYGYFEIRAQMTTEQGMWPAFWMLSTNGTWPPELDVVEVVGSNPRGVVQSVHTKAGTNTGKTTYASEDLANAFHTYGMDWTASTITFYFDGQKTYSIATPADMHTSMYMMVNLAVGGNWPGSPDSTTDWSQTSLKVDYIRAYQHDPNSVPTPTPAPTPVPTPLPGLKAVISNATNPLDLTDSFAAAVTAAGTSTTYTAVQLDIAGVDPSTSVTVAYDAAGGIIVTNKGAWNTVKNATVKSDQSGSVTVANFVDAEIALGNGNNTVNVTGTKRGSIVTGSGNDTISVSGQGLGTTDNLMRINAGDGANTISFTGPSITKADIVSGSGADIITLSGQAIATVNAGGGSDQIAASGTVGATIDAGDGDDKVTLSGAATGSVAGGAGNDTIALSGTVNAAVNGGIGNDKIDLLDQAVSTIDAGDGDDTVTLSGSAKATVNGGLGNDVISLSASANATANGDDGNDQISFSGQATGTANGGAGDDTITLSGTVNVTVNSGYGNDQIDMLEQAVGTIDAGDGNDRVSLSGSAKGTVRGGLGLDVMALSGAAAATILGEDGDDQISFSGQSSGNADGGAGNDTITLASTANVTVAGGAGNDQITVLDQAIGAVDGGDGNDTITFAGQAGGSASGGAGDDRIVIGTTGAVSVAGGAGKDVFEVSAGVHATITDFNVNEDKLLVNGIATAVVKPANGSTVVDLGNGSSVTLAGVMVSGSAIGLPSAPMTATISNAMDSSNLTGAFYAPATGAGTTTTYTTAQLGLSGVDSRSSVTVAYDANNNITVTNRGIWNGVKNARIETLSSGGVTINNFVDVQLSLGNDANTVRVTSAKRGTITTGAGNDQITVTGLSNGLLDNVMKINAGDGNNTISFSGASNTKTAISTGSGTDLITISGQASGTVNAGAGNDRIVTSTSGTVTATGGAGKDVFEFIRGAHATISDFNATDDSIVVKGGTASTTQVKAGNGFTTVDLGNGSSVILAGYTGPANAINITYA